MNNSELREPYSEIDMVDVWIVLRRHRWLFLSVFAVIFILGTVAVVLHTPKYDYSVVVHIGALRNGITGSLEPVMQPDAVVDALKNAIIPSVLLSYADAHPEFDPSRIDIQVNTPQAGALVVLQVRGPLSQDSILRQLLSSIVDKMGRDQSGLLQERIVATKTLLTRQIAQLESQQDALQKSRQQLVARGNQVDKAFTLLLVDNQIAQQQWQLLDLKQQLDVDLPTDIQLTEASTPPQRSVKPADLGKLALLTIIFVIAILLGLFAVVLAHMKSLASKRIVSGS